MLALLADGRCWVLLAVNDFGNNADAGDVRYVVVVCGGLHLRLLLLCRGRARGCDCRDHYADFCWRYQLHWQ